MRSALLWSMACTRTNAFIDKACPVFLTWLKTSWRSEDRFVECLTKDYASLVNWGVVHTLNGGKTYLPRKVIEVLVAVGLNLIALPSHHTDMI